MGVMIEIRKYRQSRFQVVYIDGGLLAVVVYRKGAVAIADMLILKRKMESWSNSGK
jgi:hypothetical protein